MGLPTEISLRRAHGGWGNTKNLFDCLSSKAEFCDDLFVGKGGEELMRPGVNTDFVTRHVLFDQDTWSLHDTGTNNEESSCNVLIIKVFEQVSANRVKVEV